MLAFLWIQQLNFYHGSMAPEVIKASSMRQLWQVYAYMYVEKLHLHSEFVELSLWYSMFGPYWAWFWHRMFQKFSKSHSSSYHHYWKHLISIQRFSSRINEVELRHTISKFQFASAQQVILGGAVSYPCAFILLIKIGFETLLGKYKNKWNKISL